MSDSPFRSFEKIERSDLDRLSVLARKNLDRLFRGATGKFKDRLIGIYLVQGAASHYVYENRGVQDLDIACFFKKLDGSFPVRRAGHEDFGPSKFGRNPDDEGYRGRRLDIMGREIEGSVIEYLKEGKAASPRYWRERPVVELWPNLGSVVWKGLG